MTMPDSVSGVAGKPRDVNYDLLRVVAMCLVIGVHVINNYMPVKMTLAGSAEVTRSVLFALFMVCNPLFIMVSGRFNLTFDADRPVSTRSGLKTRWNSRPSTRPDRSSSRGFHRVRVVPTGRVVS